MGNIEESRFPEASYAAWRAEVDRALKGAEFDKRLVTRTLEGIAVQPLYTADDWPWAADEGGFPGAVPYRRGASPVARYGAQRDMRPRYDNPDLGALERELRADLERGARSLWFCFDRQTRRGEMNAELGPSVHDRGVPCASAAELAQMLEGVPLDRVAVSLDAGANALAVAACFFEVAKRRGVERVCLESWFNADPLGALARDGVLPCSIDAARTQLCELARFVATETPRARSVTVSSVPYHDAGAHAAQELAYALATGVTYLRWLEAAGIGIEQACQQLAFSVAVGSDFFMEIAKLRALRQCWSGVVAACGGSAEAQRCVIHAATSMRSKTTRDPYVNMLRETTEAFAAAVGGADAVTTAGFDRLAGVSDAFARRIAGNAQVILDEEAHVTRVADPGGGAWYVEALTDRLVETAWRSFQALEAGGGMRVALESGAVAREVRKVADERDALLRKRKQALTGVSEFANVAERPLERAEPHWVAIASARGAALAATSNDAAAVQPLIAAVSSKRALVEHAIDAAARGASLGRLSSALAAGEAPARIAALPLRRHAASYEALRAACDAAERASGKRPSVFLCNLGPVPQHKARAQFASGFFSAGGFAVLDNDDGFDSAETAAKAFKSSGAALAVICGSDDAYATSVEPMAKALVAAGAQQVVVAGRAGDAEARYRSAGVADFIYMGCDVVATLERLLEAIGVKS